MSDISAVNPFTTNQPQTAAPSVADDLGADVFLQLLVAQLKYQDPTSPADGTEFLAQTAQFTMVEKLTEIAEAAAASQATNRNLAAASMVGQTISWLQPDGTTGRGVVQSAQLGTAGPTLKIGDTQIPFDLVTTVEAPAAAPAATATPAATSGAPTSGTTDGSPDGTDATTEPAGTSGGTTAA